MSLGKVPTEGMQHICKNCGHTGQPVNAEKHGSMNALNLGAGISMRTTVECENCHNWNWHIAPSGIGSSASGKPTGLARAKRPKSGGNSANAPSMGAGLPPAWNDRRTT